MQNLFDEQLKCVVNKPGVYYIKANNQNYIGSSIDVQDRLREHRQRLITGHHHSLRMQRIFNKYGKDYMSFSILEILDTEDTLEIRKAEKKWIDLLGPTLNVRLDPTTENNCKTTSKVVYQYKFNGELVGSFQSGKEASRRTGIQSTMISACCRGTLLSAGKYYWSYKEVLGYSYALERSKWKWRPVEMIEISSGKKAVFKNIAECAKSICNKDDNFDSICASISAVAAGKGKTLGKKYTFSYI